MKVYSRVLSLVCGVHGQDFRAQLWRRRCLVWDLISALCEKCGSAGVFGPRSSSRTGAVCSWRVSDTKPRSSMENGWNAPSGLSGGALCLSWSLSVWASWSTACDLVLRNEALVSRGEENNKPKGKALNLMVCLCSTPQLWPSGLDHDRKNKIPETSS